MTVPMPCPPSTSGAIYVAARKRRRRAPASGASDDCFACSKRNLHCDRRRPYCSQCLEVGTECSGYKTQLTWGVGVASRGKLRGLSLPIAKSAPASKTSPRSRPRAASTISRPCSDAGGNDDDIEVKLEGEAPMPTSTYTTYDFINMVPHSPTSMQGSAGTDWALSISEERIPSPHPAESISQQQLLRQSLQRLHTPMLRYDEELNLSSSTPSLSGYSDADFSPIGQSFPGDDVSYLASPIPMYSNYSPHDSPAAHYAIPADPRGPTSCPEQYYSQSEISSSISSHPTIFEMTEHRRLAPSPAACGMSDVSYDDDIVAHMSASHNSDHFIIGHHMTNSWNAADDEYANRAAAEASLRSLSAPEFMPVCLPLTQEVSPRLGFYMNYYEKIICPITVAIDSHSNPYRSHILSLATGSQSLQHAICALASCNLRMRRKQSLRQDHWRQVCEAERQDRINGGVARGSFSSYMSSNDLLPQTTLDEASVREEYQHRTQAVALLNQQLMDPSKAKDDSVLATLFILCHYRMCESGIAQFKTQFAGVKKLLGMRSSGIETGNWGWMETIFTFFDAITATVNDREAQLRGGYLEMIANYSMPDFALENLAGCDGKLFKIIATLGRLNLLSQRRPVLDPLNQLRARTPATTPPQTRPRLAGQALVDFYKFHDSKFDSNGFGHTIEDDELHTILSNSPTQSPTFSDDDLRRGQFWAEWKETRIALQTWEFDPARLVSSLGNITPTAAQIRDFGYVSEAFRHAALLYTERLANPNLPSSHLSIQNLVAQVLFYITSLSGGEGSDAMGKFLLWPVFIVGSECVSELHRSIVRTRCREIGARGGYLNNLAGLDVLERVWKEGDGGASGRGPFRWSGHMDGVDGEYIMV